MTGRKQRIGILTYAAHPANIDRIKTAMARHGWGEGVEVEYMFCDGARDIQRTRELADELLDWGPDLIFSMMTKSNEILKERADDRIPIVFWASSPVEDGLVSSSRVPGGNMTGFRLQPEHQFLRLRFLTRVLPDLRSVALLFNPTYGPALAALADLREASAQLGLELHVHEALTEAALPEAVAGMAAEGHRAAVIGPHELFNVNGTTIGDACLTHGLAAISGQESVLKGGGLAAMPPPFDIGWPLMAEVAVRILEGESPANIPVNGRIASPLIINLDAARRLHIEIPHAVAEEATALVGT